MECDLPSYVILYVNQTGLIIDELHFLINDLRVVRPCGLDLDRGI